MNNYKNKKEYNLSNTKNKKTKKKVNFIDKAIIIEVECWKAYNLEQTSDDNIENYIKELEKDKEKNNDTSNNRKNQSKKEEVTCTCNII